MLKRDIGTGVLKFQGLFVDGDDTFAAFFDQMKSDFDISPPAYIAWATVLHLTNLLELCAALLYVVVRRTRQSTIALLSAITTEEGHNTPTPGWQSPPSDLWFWLLPLCAR